ncbi:MAG: tetratricopeptide repeat protein [Ruminococcaceae bacterium]|nr:tetratricopeptide repeat protein [Oscillospiraceae bacterium]
MSDKNKLNNQSGDYREEMEELARIFKEELDKTIEESENTETETEYEVEGYEVTMGDIKPAKELTEDELCECCGERARGTEKNPNSPFCSECETILEKYPYDWKGVTTAIVTLFVTLAAIICFIVNVPVFSYTVEGEKAFNEGNLFTANQKFNKALETISEEDNGAFLNVYEKRILLNYNMLDMDSVLSDTDDYFSDFAKKMPMYKDVAEIEEEIMKMQATVLVIQDVLSQYADVSDNNYNEIINSLDALSGKKVYVKGTSYHLEGEEGFTPTGKEDIYICDDAWIEMYKYSAAQYLGKDGKIITEFLSSAAEKSEYVEILVNPLLAATYVGIGEYDKAEALLPKIQEANKENIDYYMVQSMLYRYRDKDYQKGVDTCIVGLNMLASIPDSSDMIAQIGYILSMQKTLNYIMLEDYKSAYTSAEECYSYQAETYAISVQVRDMYAMLALKTGDTETYKTLEEEIEEYGDLESGFSQDVKDYKDGKVTLQELAQSGGYDLL